MTNGCPKCDELLKKPFQLSFYGSNLCLDCQLEQADADVLKAMNRYEELKKKKEQENDDKVSSSSLV